MIIIIPLTLIGVIVFFLLGWGTMIAAWLWSHAVIVGIILLVIHGIWSAICAINSLADYSIIGLIFSVIHSIFPVVTLVSAYNMAMAEGGSFTVSLMLNWIILFFSMLGIEMLFLTAIKTEGGTSYPRLIIFSILNIGAAALLLSIVKTEGM